MSIKKTLGGDRLHSGSKMTQSLSAYEMSTHNLGKAVRTSMAVGTLVPVYCELVQKGDTWEKDIASLIHTHPTIGPIFGNFKFQVDVFTGDFRLYNKQLHNNTTGLGRKMNTVQFPLMRLNAKNPEYGEGDLNQQQIAPDSLLAYLGIRGLGTRIEGLGNDKGRVEVEREAMPLLMYWDIYKEYYANKQEEIGYCIGTTVSAGEAPIITSIQWYNPDNPGRWHEIDQNWENWDNLGTEEQPDKSIVIPTGCNITIRGENLTHRQLRVARWYVSGGNNVVGNNYIDQGATPGAANMWEQVIVAEDAKTIYFIGNKQNITLLGRKYYPSTGSGEARILENANPTAFTWDDETYAERGEGIELKEFPLSNIDDMRMKIFDQPISSPLIIGYTEEENGVLPYIETTGQTHVGNGIPDIGSNMRSFYTMNGLGIKTYQSDRFNNWLNKTWIEDVNNASAVDVSAGNFTMDSLNLAKKIYKLENRIAVSGGTYSDWLEAVYGQKTHGTAEMPVYRGGYSCMISFDTVVSSSSASDGQGNEEPLGTLGGRGISRGDKGGNIRFHAEEHCFVMAIASITPIIDYSQGNKWWTTIKTMDDIHKPQFDGIGFQDLPIYEMAAWDSKVNEEGVETHHSLGKQPSWTHYMTNQNEVFGNFAREHAEQWMVLDRRYDWDEEGILKDGTTYIDPTKFNYPFANLGIENQPFWVQLGFGAEARRIMAANQMPNL